MKRVVLAVLATIGGLVGLLSFKTHTDESIAAQLPPADGTSAGAAPSASAAPTPTPTPVPTSTPTTGGASPSTSSGSGSSTTRTLTGDAQSTRYGVVQVQVTMTGTHIDDVAFVKLTARDSRSQQINAAAAPILRKETLAAQSADIDTVSGATYTSEGYIESLQSALDQA